MGALSKCTPHGWPLFPIFYGSGRVPCGFTNPV